MTVLTAMVLPHAIAPAPDTPAPAGLNDLKAIRFAPGVLSAKRYFLDRQQRFPGPYPHHFTICEVDGEAGARAWAKHRAEDRGTYDGSAVGVYESMRPRYGETAPSNRTHMLIAMTTPLPGRDQEYNDWYWNQHYPDGMRLPGMISGERFKIRPEFSDEFPHQYMALYDMRTLELPYHYKVLNRISRTPEMPLTDALGPVFAAWYVMAD